MQFFNELVNINTNYFRKRSSNRKEFVKRLVAFFLLILLGLGERYCYHPCFMDEEKKKNTQR